MTSSPPPNVTADHSSYSIDRITAPVLPSSTSTNTSHTKDLTRTSAMSWAANTWKEVDESERTASSQMAPGHHYISSSSGATRPQVSQTYIPVIASKNEAERRRGSYPGIRRNIAQQHLHPNDLVLQQRIDQRRMEGNVPRPPIHGQYRTNNQSSQQVEQVEEVLNNLIESAERMRQTAVDILMSKSYTRNIIPAADYNLRIAYAKSYEALQILQELSPEMPHQHSPTPHQQQLLQQQQRQLHQRHLLQQQHQQQQKRPSLSLNHEFAEPKFQEPIDIRTLPPASEEIEYIRNKRSTALSIIKSRKRARSTAGPGVCHSCSSTETPEWRRGPDGARTLCNACGLHYAKMMKKKGKPQGSDNNEDSFVEGSQSSHSPASTTFSNTSVILPSQPTQSGPTKVEIKTEKGQEWECTKNFNY